MITRPFQLSTLKFESFSVVGYSVAGEETVICVPELDVVFDIGRAPRESLAMNHVLLTHGHMDHAAGIGYYFSQRDFQGMSGGKALAPATLVPALERLMVAWSKVEGHPSPHTFIPMNPGDDYELRRNLLVRAFATRHVNATLGYSIIDVRFKLKEEYLGLDSREIVALKTKGVEITHRTEVPLITCFGDTAHSNYSDLEHVRTSKVLLLECTFFDPDHVRRARKGKHLHVNDLPDLLEGMDNEHIVLIHVTRRTNMAEARKALRKTLRKDQLDRISFLMSRRFIESD
ncbi:MAG: MBL fold metallo-hydrolase [Planctomycetota bacterium]